MELQKLMESKDIFFKQGYSFASVYCQQRVDYIFHWQKIVYSGKRKNYNPVHTALVGHTEESKKEVLIKREKEVKGRGYCNHRALV